MLEFRQLSTSSGDRELLRDFHDRLYASAFPNADERESLDNMQASLSAMARGELGRSSYRIVLVQKHGRTVAGAIADYFDRSNAALVEFIAVDQNLRRTGLGGRVLEDMVHVLGRDARALSGQQLDLMFGEAENPRCYADTVQGLDPATRLRALETYGFAVVDFPYVQPALSPDQQPVDHLLLLAKSLQRPAPESIPAPRLLSFLWQFMRLAVRIEVPERTKEYARAEEYLADGRSVPLHSVSEFLAEASATRLTSNP